MRPVRSWRSWRLGGYLLLLLLGGACSGGDPRCYVCEEAQGDAGPPLDAFEIPAEPDPACPAEGASALTLRLSAIDAYQTLSGRPRVFSGVVEGAPAADGVLLRLRLDDGSYVLLSGALGGALPPPVEDGQPAGLVYSQQAPSWRTAWAEVYDADGALLWYAYGGGAPATERLAPGDSFVVRLEGARCLPQATSSCSAWAQAPLRVARAATGGGALSGALLLYAGEAGVLAPVEEPEATWVVQVGRAERWATGPGCSEAPPAVVSVVVARLEAVR